MIKKPCLLISVLALLSGCASAPPTPPPAPVVVKKSPLIQHQVSQIETAGIQVIQQGDRLTMVIPTDQYFEPMTTSVAEGQQKNLQHMAIFVKNFADHYPNSVIRVTGYTDQVFSHKAQLELSQSYASVVSSYLFNTGIDPRRIATQGRGSNEPVAGESTPSRATMNRRVV